MSNSKPAIVRNRDTWRIANHVSDPNDRQTLVEYGDTWHALWPTMYVQPINPADLDRALMGLRESDKDAYDTFLNIMLRQDTDACMTESPNDKKVEVVARVFVQSFPSDNLDHNPSGSYWLILMDDGTTRWTYASRPKDGG